MSALRRYGLDQQGDQRSARCPAASRPGFQILLLELSGATLLLLDEPTDNLDVLSAEALEEGLEAFEGTVLAVTHDRWFARSLDRFLVFGPTAPCTRRTSPSSTRRASSARAERRCVWAEAAWTRPPSHPQRRHGPYAGTANATMLSR